jgi:hypothetical protein
VLPVAARALPHYRVDLAPDGVITVPASSTVSPDTRVMPG